MATEVGRKEGSEFWWRDGAEFSFLDASNSGVASDKSISYSDTFFILAKAAHIPGHNG